MSFFKDCLTFYYPVQKAHRLEGDKKFLPLSVWDIPLVIHRRGWIQRNLIPQDRDMLAVHCSSYHSEMALILVLVKELMSNWEVSMVLMTRW